MDASASLYEPALVNDSDSGSDTDDEEDDEEEEEAAEGVFLLPGRRPKADYEKEKDGLWWTNDARYHVFAYCWF